jgi:hypothetical protein
MTTSKQIEDYLRSDGNFLGCFPHDNLPPFPSTLPKSIIINTDSGRGEHWIAMLFTKKKCFYFDSFGVPVINTNILNYVKQYKTVTYSNQCIQDYLSTSCGLFCIAFVMYVKNKKKYLSFLSIFKDLKCNDSVVKYLLM